MCNDHGIERAKPQAVALSSMHRRDVVRSLWAGTMVMGVASVGGCETVVDAFTPGDDQLVQMSAQAWAETKAQTPIWTNAAANRRMQTIGNRISSVVNYPGAEWEFVVFDSDELNAFVLPGGKVGFYRGLLNFADNDDQVAAVLGHEVGHVTARHAAKRIGQQTAASLALQGGQMLLGSTVQMSSETLNMVMAAAGAGVSVGVLMPFSRENESQADLLGADYMHAAGYDVKQSVRLWEKMAAASTSRPQEWMSTHPDPNRRARELEQYIASKGWA